MSISSPESVFQRNSFTYERTPWGRLTVFVGFRGHVHPYSTVLTPSRLRTHPPLKEYLAYKVMEGYAGDLLREGYYRHRGKELLDLQVRGILQHHKTIGSTDVLDLTYDTELARRYALHKQTGHPWPRKSEPFKPGDYSSIHQVVVRLLGHSDEPLPILFHGEQIRFAPFNICPLESVTEYAQSDRGFGISHLGPEDNDPFGMIMNVTEWRYHPTEDPAGWRDLPAWQSHPRVRYSPSGEVLDTADLLGEPPGLGWLKQLLSEIRWRVERRFRVRVREPQVW